MIPSMYVSSSFFSRVFFRSTNSLRRCSFRSSISSMSLSFSFVVMRFFFKAYTSLRCVHHREVCEQKLVGIIDTSQGFAIAAHYDEILIGDSLIVAYDPLTHVYDIFDRQCRLIYTLPGKYDYVVPNGECCVDVVDLDAGIYTIKIPSYLITNY